MDEPDRGRRDPRSSRCYLILPSLALGNPCQDGFAWKYVNYAPIVTLGALLLLTIWWEVSAKNWFKGP